MTANIENTTIGNIMNKNVVSVKGNDTIESVVKTMYDKEVGSVIVVNESVENKSTTTERDVIRVIAKKGRGVFNLTSEDFMSKPLFTAFASTDIEKIEKEMRKRNIKYVPVVESGKLAGIVTLKDVIKYLEFRINYLTFR